MAFLGKRTVTGKLPVGDRLLNKLKLSSGEVRMVEGNVRGTAHCAGGTATDMLNFILLATTDSTYYPPGPGPFAKVAVS